ncbi:MAG: hypothetical protein ACI8SA_001321 [Dokdonia sp.]|jgi:hypothetical protein
MLKQIPISIAMFCFIGLANIGLGQFTDDFTDADFTTNPTWTGNISDFQISATNTLQLNAPAVTSNSYLVTPSQAIGNAQYDFNVRLDFDPSTSNYAKVYLTSSAADLSGSLNGYYVQIGGASGTLDDVSLYFQNGTAGTKIIDGTNGIAALAPELNVRVTRDMNGNWELLIDTALNGTYFSEGTVLNSTHTSSAYFGVFCKYTSTRSTKFFFDDFVVTGGPIMDIDPPTIDSVIAVSANQVDVYFNEIVDLNSSQVSNNYAVNNGVGNPASSARDAVNFTKVHLNYTTAIPNNSYVLTVINVADLSGNTIPSATSVFIVNVATPTNFGDVIINEIFADPTPQIGLPNSEYIELTNTSNTPINLSNWEYADASSSVTIPNYILSPNSHVILCKEADTALFAIYGSVLGLSSWPSLNNSADFLGLRDPSSNLVDTVSYTSAWFQDGTKSAGGWSLERINPKAPCSDANNWRASTNANGGTPGQQNSIFNSQSDNRIPQVANFSIIGSDVIQLSFTKSIDSTLNSATNYAINNGRTIVAMASINLNTIRLTVSPNLVQNEIYELTISNLVDCYGNAMNDTTFNVAIGRSPLPFEIVITEIYANPDPSNLQLPEAEFAEIYNTTTEPLSLNGLIFSDRSTDVSLPSEVLFPGEYAILTEDIVAAQFSPFGRVVVLTSWPSLNNSTDLITLASATNIIDLVLYSDTWHTDFDKKSGGWSLELINPDVTCLGGANWSSSIATNQATPGSINSIYDPNLSVDFSLVSASAISLNEIELVFSKWLDPNKVIPSNFTLTNGVNINATFIDPDQPNLITLSVTPNLENGAKYEVLALNMTDCSGGSITDSVAIVSLPSFQDILINEVLFNPYIGGTDFVEVYNTTNQSIDLKNWSLLYYNSSGDSAYKPLTTSSYIILPQQFIVISEDSGNVQFEYPNSTRGNFLVTDLPTYSNSEGSVTLLNQMGLMTDDFQYDEDMHFELISDPKGVTLERVNYKLGINSSNNWHSAASTAGFATPGFENSQFNTGSEGSTEVTISPKTFTPNNDGYTDVTSINYNFEASGFVATITVHNAQGQLIQTLLNNQSIEAKGSIIWNGTNERMELMPTGMYIVMFRIFNLENEQQVYKNVVVLAMP